MNTPPLTDRVELLEQEISVLQAKVEQLERRLILSESAIGIGMNMPLIKDRVELLEREINKLFPPVVESRRIPTIIRERASRRYFPFSAGIIYILTSSLGLYKIGRTIDLKDRLSSYISSSPEPPVLLKVFEVTNMAKAEKFLHRNFQDKRRHGEWFELSGEDVTWLESLESLEGLY